MPTFTMRKPRLRFLCLTTTAALSPTRRLDAAGTTQSTKRLACDLTLDGRLDPAHVAVSVVVFALFLLSLRGVPTGGAIGTSYVGLYNTRAWRLSLIAH